MLNSDRGKPLFCNVEGCGARITWVYHGRGECSCSNGHYINITDAIESPYGFCPVCGAKGVKREKRPNGNDTCTMGHVYPAADALDKPPMKTHDNSGYMERIKSVFPCYCPKKDGHQDWHVNECPGVHWNKINSLLTELAFDYEQSNENVRKNLHLIDAALHGSDNAAPRPSACDLIHPAAMLRAKYLLAYDFIESLTKQDSMAGMQAKETLQIIRSIGE